MNDLTIAKEPGTKPANPHFQKLMEKLEEMFQLDQSDLDFGIYRIMGIKREEITDFLRRDLLPQIQEGLKQYRPASKATLQQELAEAIKQAEALGIDPNTTPGVQKLQARLKEDSVDLTALENEIYDHLYTFFRRYYSEGDFLSRRVYKKDTYAIPYEGEEVKLHWANRDQYYIKTSEYLRDYSFALRPEDAKNPMRVHFRLRDAEEGEHGNIKEAKDKERLFILAAENPITLEQNELSIYFEYRLLRPDDAQTWEGKKNPKQKDINPLNVRRILAVTDPALNSWITELAKPKFNQKGESKGSKIEAHLNRYTARNTFDYFIHKDLGGFLRRELDFYIKNEMMFLDDIEQENAPRIEQYLSKIKITRKIAHKLIDFLAQIEDFQKKLWLKKKFVIETNYCLTLDIIPEEFYAEIAANKEQVQEWIELLAINEIKGDLAKSGFSIPLTIEFLKSQPSLVLDTKHFPDTFTARLLETIHGLDEKADGLLIHSENFQALSLLQEKYKGRIQCIYIDPPYNSPSSEIVYKNSYKHSSWHTLIDNRLNKAKSLFSDEGTCVVAIDENEHNGLERIILESFPDHNVTSVSIEHNKKGVQGNYFSYTHEYAVFVVPKTIKSINRTKLPREEWEYSNLRNWGGESLRTDGKNCFYPIFVKDGKIISFGDICDDNFHPDAANVQDKSGVVAVYPIDVEGVERKWRYERNSVEAIRNLLQVDASRKGDIQIMKAKSDAQFKTMWYAPKYNAGDYGTKILTNMGFEKGHFDFPKSLHTVKDCVYAVTNELGLILDYFAGSGTTGHSVINLNREDGGKRKFILVEMGGHFDTVLLPRIKKITYGPEWKDGKPKRPASMEEIERGPKIIKYLRLESYEDTLNNLEIRRDQAQENLLAQKEHSDMREDYLLHYMLQSETRNSPSLLKVEAFSDPTSYQLKVKIPGSEESRLAQVDLIETLNYLIGLKVDHIAAPELYRAEFETLNGKLAIKDKRLHRDESGPYWFRTIIGNNPDGRKVLIIWRKMTGHPAEDNLVLDAWFTRNKYSSKDHEFDLIYVNGDNNLENLKTPDDQWKVRLIEETFHQLMFEGDNQ